GWQWLKEITLHAGGSCRRLRTDKPSVSKTNDGKVNIHLGERYSDDELTGTSEEVWLMYGIGVAADAHEAQPPGTPMDRERLRVPRLLEVYRQKRVERPATRNPVWDLLAESEERGYLDEAIYLLLMDPDLVADYRAYRNTATDRLVAYLDDVVAPLPGN